MNNIFSYLKGDKPLWAAVILISLLSFLPVYSASSNLQYVIGSGTTFTHLIKHGSFILIGIFFVLILQRFNYKYFGGFAVLLIPVVIIALLATMLQGNTIDGANASRWLKIPGIPLQFQTSSFAFLVLMIYVARYLTKIKDNPPTFAESLVYLFLPILAVVGLIFPANGSTAIMIFMLVITILFIGGYPLKYLTIIGLTGVIAAGLFIGAAFMFEEQLENTRVHTWKSRIDRFINDEGIESYQVMQAKTAIVEGGVFGVGSGKSALKQTLPQSSSDFIFAIIVEEYGLWGAGILLLIYGIILYRIIFIATRIHTTFGTILVLAVGFPIIFQALINMCVAVNLMPVTGQPLPLISYGGTAMWVTYIALGIILNVSQNMKSKEEIQSEIKKQSEQAIEDIA